MNIIKRNGTEAVFNEEEIISGVAGANSEVDEANRLSDIQIGYVAGQVKERCEQLGYSPAVQEIQKMVEDELMTAGFYDVARHYIVYRHARDVERAASADTGETIAKAAGSKDRLGVLDLLSLHVTADFENKTVDARLTVDDVDDNFGKMIAETEPVEVLDEVNPEPEPVISSTEFLNYKRVVDDYLHINDWRVKENSTVTYSVGGLILSNSGAVTANYWLSEVYDEEVAEAHRSAAIHLHDLSMLTGYCAGWSLKQLIQEGLGGIPGKITSSPAGHLSTLCNQMVNFLGIMQNEWAGAQAFSSFDTYLAPFVKVDKLTQKEVKQCIQSFVFGVNTPSRWGCVDTDTEVLSVDGFKKYDELKEGDLIYTWKDGNLELNPVRKVIQKPYKGVLHAYKGRNYNQTVTPNHRMLVRKHNSNECVIKLSEEIFDAKTPYALPVAFKSSGIENNELNDDLITLAAMVYTDGSFDYRDGSLHKISIVKSPKRFGNEELKAVLAALDLQYSVSEVEGEYGKMNKYVLYGDAARFVEDLCGAKDRIDDKFMYMDMNQASLFLHIWASFDGEEQKWMCQYDNDVIRDQLQQIALLSGHCSHIRHKKLASGKTTNYVKIRKVNGVYPTERTEVEYDGIVWCPNVENGTAVFRKDGCVYISGQTQAPFSNITLDWVVPNDLVNLNAIVGGKEMDFTYGDCQKEMDMINKAFIEVMIEGDANGRGFQYPIPTYSITRDFNWDETENNKLLFEMTAKYGTPYFSNYINSDMEPSDVRSMCCRLRLDLRELRKKSGGFFGSGESTGSIGVVTINLPRIAYLATSEADFYEQLDHLMDVAARSLHTKRAFITALLEQGLYPYTKRYLGNFDNHFSTIGLIGMNEVGLNAKWLRSDLTDVNVQRFAKDVLNHMRERLSDYQEKYGDLYNLEATPAESTTYRFAKHDKERYPDIITANMKGTPYYTNSSHLPVGYTEDVFSALDIQDELQTLYTSGTVFHAFLGEKLPDWKAAANLVRKIAENYKLPYYTMSPTYSVCKEHGYLVGEHFACPHCGEKTEVYSRITGYYRPVQNWNDGKAQEYKDRKVYDISASRLTHQGPIAAEMDEVVHEAQQEVNDCPPGDPLMESFVPEEIKAEEEIPEGLTRILLFKTPTCPNCKAAVAMLDKAGISYESLNAEEEEDLVRKYNIKQAPTLVIVDGDEFEKHKGVSNIKGWIKAHK